jgi:hypothetical protein
MISLAETRFALRGLLRILRFDSSFVQFYDRSRDGAVRSFWLAAPLLLIFLLRLYLQHDPQQPPLTLRMSAAMVIAYAINWAYFPLFLIWVSRFIDRQTKVVGCIAVYNWLSILAIFTSLPISLLGWAGMDDGFLQALDLVSVVISLVCEGYILAVCLQISGFFAAAFVILDLVLNQILFTLANHLGVAPLF